MVTFHNELSHVQNMFLSNLKTMKIVETNVFSKYEKKEIDDIAVRQMVFQIINNKNRTKVFSKSEKKEKR